MCIVEADFLFDALWDFVTKDRDGDLEALLYFWTNLYTLKGLFIQV